MKLSVVVGGQYGSEGKGAVAGHLAARSEQPVVAIRVAGPNAGHTVYGRCPGQVCGLQDGHLDSLPVGEGHPWKLRQVPVAAVTRPDAVLVIAAGSEVDLAVLEAEVAALDSAGYDASSRLMVDFQASVIDPGFLESEAELVARIGSTGKGVGKTRAARIMRTCDLYGTRRRWAVRDAWQAIAGPVHVIVEGTQGYALGLHAGWYPYCTSSDCRAIDFMSMAGIPPQAADVWVVLRTWPIRVAGTSGPMHQEVTWDVVGQPVERTTVTNKVRRVGRWDRDLARAAVKANGRCKVALTMVDYDLPFLAGETGSYGAWAAAAGMTYGPGIDPVVLAEKYLATVESDCGAPIRLVGTGPDTILER